VNTKNKAKQREELLKLLIEKGGPILSEAQQLMSSMKFKSKHLKNGLKYVRKWWKDLVRPALMVLTCEALGANPEIIKPLARGLILTAAAIDIHDDIIDKTEVKGPYRRKTVLAREGQAHTLILGDALFVQGLIELSKTYHLDIPKERVDQALQVIREALIELGDAEALEQEIVGKYDTPPEKYLEIIYKKAADTEAYLKATAILAGATPQQIQQLANYGRKLGMIIILADDIEDTLNPNELKSRITKEPPPLPLLYAYQNPKHQQEIRQLIQRHDARQLTKKIKETKSIARTKKAIKSLASDLRSFPHHYLISFIGLTIEEILGK